MSAKTFIVASANQHRTSVVKASEVECNTQHSYADMAFSLTKQVIQMRSQFNGRTDLHACTSTRRSWSSGNRGFITVWGGTQPSRSLMELSLNHQNGSIWLRGGQRLSKSKWLNESVQEWLIPSAHPVRQGSSNWRPNPSNCSSAHEANVLSLISANCMIF